MAVEAKFLALLAASVNFSMFSLILKIFLEIFIRKANIILISKHYLKKKNYCQGPEYSGLPI